MLLSNETLRLSDTVRALRRALHRIPEPALEESRTQRLVLETLRGWGVEAREIAGTGVKAVIRGGLPGPVTALRADMDALNVAEATGCDFMSEIPGWMHACGHDGHMAMLLSAARLLLDNAGRLRGTAVLLFQPAEEVTAGAARMLEGGALQDPPVDRIFALHLMPHIDEGRIGVVTGPVMAAACEFAIRFTGKSAHGAMPHAGVDTIVAAAQFVCNAQAVVSRGKPPEAPGLLTFGRFDGGRRHNIIAGSVEMEGTYRAYDGAVMAEMGRRLAAHIRAAEEAWGVRAEYRVTSEVPPTVNDAGLAAQVLERCRGFAEPVSPLMVAEDFSRYGAHAPAFIGFLGCRNEAAGFTGPLHGEAFNFSETALLWGLEYYRRILID